MTTLASPLLSHTHTTPPIPSIRQPTSPLPHSHSIRLGAAPLPSQHMLQFTNHPRPNHHYNSSCCKHHPLTCAAGSRSSTDLSVSDSLEILNLDSAAVTDAAEVRKAYYSRMREIHPDVNPDQDTTQTAALVNAAYAALLKLTTQRSRSVVLCTRKLKEVGESASGVVVTGDAFDRCDGAVNCFFVSPFACGTDPFLWRELQDAVSEALNRLTFRSGELTGSDRYQEVTEVDMEEALLANGLRAAPGAVVWLTENQSAAVEELMVELEASLAFEVVEWMLVDSLLRAERANRRGWQS